MTYGTWAWRGTHVSIHYCFPNQAHPILPVSALSPVLELYSGPHSDFLSAPWAVVWLLLGLPASLAPQSPLHLNPLSHTHVSIPLPALHSLQNLGAGSSFTLPHIGTLSQPREEQPGALHAGCQGAAFSWGGGHLTVSP